jgi:carbamoyltransferase
MNHHLSHAASAYYGSHFNKGEKILVLTADGGGDGLCATVYIGENGKLRKISETKAGNSLGNIYSITTYYMGFTPLEHEYKLMGMAPYSSVHYSKKVAKKFGKYLTFDKKTLEFKRKIPEKTNFIYQRLRKDLELERFDNICGGLQMFTEDLAISWVKEALKKSGCNKIALAGGLFMNVKLNQRISELDEVKDIFIMPSCGDESLPIGGCYYKYYELTGKLPKPLYDIYFGPDFSNEEVLNELNKDENLSYILMKNPAKEVGTLLAKGEIVARCSGRMEFGARALGNRSILADASNLDNVRIINMMIKKRDFWMPFAPVMLEEDSKKYIHNPKNLKAPYMILTFNSTERFKDFIGGVQQADLTARAQIITREYNPEYYDIIKTFKDKTGRGVLMNTSFNLHGLPLVYGPKEALYVFKNSGLKYLQLGDYLVKKNEK